MRKYDDIIDLPHHVSERHPQMSMHDRAAQFSPFAALTGFGAQIEETARLTEERIELDEGGKALLDERLRALRERLPEQPEVTVTYFLPDERKAGGAYIAVTGRVRRIDPLARTLTLADGAAIPLEDIYALDGAEFDEV